MFTDNQCGGFVSIGGSSHDGTEDVWVVAVRDGHNYAVRP